ncbi:hypothetical protein [Novosphingobium sp.]|uniref:hypothetical protein n=1 Tax=Novosphingobium sp. TaxID=1874826 RepID=UPI0035663658|nr:hypothetical protein [Novosphingobium sp.]
MNKLTVVTPTIINHSVTSLKVTRIKVSESSAATSKFKREGKAVLMAAGLCLAIWMVLAWVMMNGL